MNDGEAKILVVQLSNDLVEEIFRESGDLPVRGFKAIQKLAEKIAKDDRFSK